jgi:hypothetical protein
MESIECLKGNGPSDLEELVVTQGGLLLLTSKGALQTYLCFYVMLSKFSWVIVKEMLLYFCTMCLVRKNNLFVLVLRMQN